MTDNKKNVSQNVKNFKILIRKSIFIDSDEVLVFDSIPDEIWEEILNKNFSGNLNYAKRVILDNQDKINLIDYLSLDREKHNIDNFELTKNTIMEYINENKKIVFITDYDNDGSLSQTVINQFLKTLPEDKRKNVLVEYAREVNGNKSRGLTVDLVDDIQRLNSMNQDDDFLVITTDNGINSREDQLKINEKYKNSKLIITDHHDPEEGMYILENKQTIVFNPKYHAAYFLSDEMLKERKIKKNKDYSFWKEYNISGANTIAVVLKKIIEENNNIEEMSLEEQVEKIPMVNEAMEIIDNIARASNMLDYVDSHPADKPFNVNTIHEFLSLQPLLNINNSMAKFITGMLSENQLKILKDNIPDIDIELIEKLNKQVVTANFIAMNLINNYLKYKLDSEFRELSNNKETYSQQMIYEVLNNGVTQKYLESGHLDSLETNTDINLFKYMDDGKVSNDGNTNYIEQLRPIIFEYSSNNYKTAFESGLMKEMLYVYQNLMSIEKQILKEIRKGDISKTYALDNVNILVIDKELQGFFNRKLINKAYNGKATAFNLTIDGIKDSQMSGSFRASIDKSDLFKVGKEELEEKLNIDIKMPGHEKAAGFIITTKDGRKITEKESTEILNSIAHFIDKRAELIIEKNNKNTSSNWLISDLTSIELLNKINKVIRGNIPHYERISPIIQLNEDVIFTNQSTGKQYSLQEMVDSQNYGYITIQTKLSKTGRPDAVIIPTEIVRKIIKNGFKDYVQVDYLDGGAFIGSRIINSEKVTNDNSNVLFYDSTIPKVIDEAYSDGKLDNVIHQTEEDIRNNIFYKYNRYKDEDFENFKNLIFAIIESNGVDGMTIFDVEAIGFGNAKLINLGTNTYFIDNEHKDIEKMSTKEFQKRCFKSYNGEYILIDEDELKSLKKLKFDIYNALIYTSDTNTINKLITKVNFKTGEKTYYIAENSDGNFPNHKKVSNFKFDKNEVTINRGIRAEMLSRLVKPTDFVIPAYMTKLTGITNEIARKHGVEIEELDTVFAEYFKGKNLIVGAHNTNYDDKILRANTPLLYEQLSNFEMYDSAMASKYKKLGYDNIEVVNFKGIAGLPETVFFYNNELSDINLINFLKNQEDGEYPDMNGQHRLIINNKELFYKDLLNNETVKILEPINNLISYKYEKVSTDIGNPTNNYGLPQGIQDEDDEDFKDDNIEQYIENEDAKLHAVSFPLSRVKYSAQFLAEHKAVKNLLLSNEDFDVKLVDLDRKVFQNLTSLEKGALKEFQLNYRFDKNLNENVMDFSQVYKTFNVHENQKLFKKFLREFIVLNKEIQQKFSDAWIYKAILKIKDPKYSDLNKDTIELVSQLSGFQTNVVERVFTEAIEFKKKFNCDYIIPHETHVNGPYEGNHIGDVAFEDKVTIGLLSDRTRDGYSESLYPTVSYFNELKRKFQFGLNLVRKLSSNSAADSMSFKQNDYYSTRKSKTQMILDLEEKNELIENGVDGTIIKFKLENDVLQEGKHVYAVMKDVQISNEQIEIDSKNISKLIIASQVGSMFPKQTIENMDEYVKIKDDLKNRYHYMTLTASDKRVKDLKNLIFEYVTGKENLADEPSTRKKVDPYSKIENAFTNYFDNVTKSQVEEIYNAFILYKNSLEKELEISNNINETESFSNFSHYNVDNNDLFYMLHSCKKIEELLKSFVNQKTITEEQQNMIISELDEEDNVIGKIDLHNIIKKVNEKYQVCLSPLDVVSNLADLFTNNYYDFANKRSVAVLEEMKPQKDDKKTKKNKVIEVDYVYSIFSEDFFGFESETIERQNPVKQMFTYFNYLEYSTNDIYNRLAKPILIDKVELKDIKLENEEKLSYNKKNKPKI